jgi:prophage regulatory protein
MKGERLLPRSEVERRTGLSRSTIYERMAAGRFPPARREPETGTVRWLESEVDAWIEAWVARSAVVGSAEGTRADRMKNPIKSGAYS